MKFAILLDNFAKFLAAFAKLSNKAQKLLGKPFILHELGREKKSFDVSSYTGIERDLRSLTVVNVEIENAIIPVLDGWVFAASITHMQDDSGKAVNVIKSALGDSVEMPKRYRDALKVCEHCGYTRKRTETFLVYHQETNEFKQVGRKCLQDFTGLNDILLIAGLFENLLAVKEENEFDGCFSGDMRNAKYNEYFLNTFLVVTMAVIRAYGWMSGKEAYENHKTSTKELVLRYFTYKNRQKTHDDQKFFDKVHANMNDSDSTTVESTVEYFANLDSENLNDYQFNCYALAKAGRVQNDTAGIAASMLNAYERVLAEKRFADNAKNSVHFGDIDEYLNAQVQVLKVYHHSGDYGITTFLTLKVVSGVFNSEGKEVWKGRGKNKVLVEATKEIPVGAILVWKASGSIDTQPFGSIVGTEEITGVSGYIVKHDEYNGMTQTHISKQSNKSKEARKASASAYSRCSRW